MFVTKTNRGGNLGWELVAAAKTGLPAGGKVLGILATAGFRYGTLWRKSTDAGESRHHRKRWSQAMTFWDEEDEDCSPIIRVEEQEWMEIIQHLLTQRCTGTRVVRWRRPFVDVFYVGGGGRPRHFVRHARDETEVTIPLIHLTPVRLGEKCNDGRKNGVLWWLRPPAFWE